MKKNFRMRLLAALFSVFTSDAWSQTQGFSIDDDSKNANVLVDLGEAGLEANQFQLIGPPGVGIKGMFGPAFYWPIIPIHATLLPNGRVLSYGTSPLGKQGSSLVHALWNPSAGPGSDNPMLHDSVSTDIFCAGQSLISSTGETLITGGDNTINNVRNYSNNKANFFNYRTGAIGEKPGVHMAFKRWYPTLVGLANGKILILGGRDELNIPTFASTPEVYTPGVGFLTLSGAKNESAYGASGDSWWYPRAFQAPNGRVFVIAHSGKMFYVNAAGNGSVLPATFTRAPASSYSLPSIMFAPGKILSLRNNNEVIAVNLNGTIPSFERTAPVSQTRYWSNATVLADGKVLVSGGSALIDVTALNNVAYHTELWDPATGLWTRGAVAKKPRLYHSTALLLRDGRVLTGGGGAPGPVTNLNAEIYYPPYLFKHDGSRQLANRPAILTAPTAIITWNSHFNVSLDTTKSNANSIRRVNLVRLGSSTHSFDNDQRFMELGFTRLSANTLAITSPQSPNIAPPGYYMLFVFNQAGTPSIAKIVHLDVK